MVVGGRGGEVDVLVSQSDTERCLGDNYDPSFLRVFADTLKNKTPALLHSLTLPSHSSSPPPRHFIYISSKLTTTGGEEGGEEKGGGGGGVTLTRHF